MTKYEARNGAIYKDSAEIALRGINWFGLEGELLNVHGLWTGRSIESFIDQMVELEFNAIRLPLSPESLQPGRKGLNQPKSGLDTIHDVLKITRSKGVYVLLDIHNCSCLKGFMDKPGPGIGSCTDYTLDKWKADVKHLADLSVEYFNVIGIDLFNEPYGYKWSDWARVCTDVAKVALDTNPNILIFVEGVANESDNGGTGVFWGENLVEASTTLPGIPKDRLVFSPHVYGPSVAHQTYFDAPNFPKNMPAIWDRHFGYLIDKGFTLCIGEFGGRYQGNDRTWQDAFVEYLNERKLGNFFYWSLNPNSGDTGGILKDDWQSVDQDKLSLIRKISKKSSVPEEPLPAVVVENKDFKIGNVYPIELTIGDVVIKAKLKVG